MLSDILLLITTAFGTFVIIYYFTLNSIYFYMLLLGAKEMLYFNKKTDINICKDKESELAPTVSVIMTTYNEEKVIMDSVRALRNLKYPSLEIILVNDGSEDSTLDVLMNKLRLIKIKRKENKHLTTEPIKNAYKSLKDDRILVIDKENGGKADAMNAGLNFSQSELFISIDGDTLIEKNSLQKLVQNYLDIDENVVAIGGIVRVANNCKIEDAEVKEARVPKKFLPAIQAVEYVRAFLFGRSGLSSIDALPLISGAFGIFKTDAVIDAGGYNPDTVGEDIDLVLRLHKYLEEKGIDYDITFIPDPVCWTLVPEDIVSLKNQRSRWQRGLMEALTLDPKMILNPNYGRIGLIGLPLFFFFEMLAPIIEVAGLVFFTIAFIMGWVSLPFTLLFLLVSIGFGMILSISSLVLDEYSSKRYNSLKDKVKLIGFAVLENFGYRQMRSLFRTIGAVHFFTDKEEWGTIKKNM